MNHPIEGSSSSGAGTTGIAGRRCAPRSPETWGQPAPGPAGRAVVRLPAAEPGMLERGEPTATWGEASPVGLAPSISDAGSHHGEPRGMLACVAAPENQARLEPRNRLLVALPLEDLGAFGRTSSP